MMLLIKVLTQIEASKTAVEANFWASRSRTCQILRKATPIIQIIICYGHEKKKPCMLQKILRIIKDHYQTSRFVHYLFALNSINATYLVKNYLIRLVQGHWDEV